MGVSKFGTVGEVGVTLHYIHIPGPSSPDTGVIF